MAKVTGPLHSDGASGKLANAVVYFPWKGINVVRKYKIPANPMTENQGDIRQILGGLGRAGHAPQIGSQYQLDAKALATGNETYVSAIVSFVIKNLIPDGAAFDTVYSTYNSHSAKSEFVSKAALLGLTDFQISYRGATNTFPAGMQLYLLAYYAITRKNPALPAFDRAPYTTALSSWDSSKVDDMATDMAV